MDTKIQTIHGMEEAEKNKKSGAKTKHSFSGRGHTTGKGKVKKGYRKLGGEVLSLSANDRRGLTKTKTRNNTWADLNHSYRHKGQLNCKCESETTDTTDNNN